MKKPILILLMSGLIVSLFSCGGSQNDQSEQTMDVEETEAVPTFSGKTATGTIHSVADYAAWEKVYAEVSDPEARIGVLRGIEDPNMVAVFEYTTSHQDARVSFASEELKGHMQRAGVNSEPQTTYYDMVYMNSEEVIAPHRLAINHEVQDFDLWKVAFDNDESRRKEAGMSLIGMATDPENPNKVYIMFAVADMEKAKAMIENPELRQVMDDAGVISEPQFTFWQIPSAVQ